MPELLSSTTILGLAGGLLLLAATIDLKSLTIPNWISLALFALYPAFVWLSPQSVNWVDGLAAGATLFVAGAIAFGFGKLGGGDVKLLAATGLYAGWTMMPQFLVVTAIAGGVIAMVMTTRLQITFAYLAHRFGQSDVRDVLLGRHIPYGIAIAVGGLTLIRQLLQV